MSTETVDDFDPFKARSVDHTISDWGTLAHLLCCSLGTGMLAMPAAFSSTGLVFGIFTTIVTVIISSDCVHLLVGCAHELYKRSGKTHMGFAEVVEEACLQGPAWSKRWAPYARMYVNVGISLTYFATCSCYCVIITKNFQKVVINHFSQDHWLNNTRIMILLLLIPLLILASIRNLKYLAPVSFFSTICMGTGLAIIFYYLLQDVPSVSERSLIRNLSGLPLAVSVTIYAIATIGVVMPLENHMEKPLHFVGWCGVFNQGMLLVTIVYIVLGFLGFLKYGESVRGVITLNLPISDVAAQAVMIMIGVAIYCSFGQHFYVCTDMTWNAIKHKFLKHPTIANYVFRTMCVVCAVVVAIAVPTIEPFVGLIGALFFSTLGLMLPIYLDLVTFWGQGFGRFYWKIVRNVVVIAVALTAFVLGTLSSLEDIAKLYEPQTNTTIVS